MQARAKCMKSQRNKNVKCSVAKTKNVQRGMSRMSVTHFPDRFGHYPCPHVTTYAHLLFTVYRVKGK